MGWYTVVKRIRGRSYLYLQMTYRVGGKVKTKNKYLGRANAGRASFAAGAPANLPTANTAPPKPSKTRPHIVIEHIKKYQDVIRKGSDLDKRSERIHQRLARRKFLSVDYIKERIELAAIRREFKKQNMQFEALLPEHVVLRDLGYKVDYTRLNKAEKEIITKWERTK